MARAARSQINGVTIDGMDVRDVSCWLSMSRSAGLVAVDLIGKPEHFPKVHEGSRVSVDLDGQTHWMTVRSFDVKRDPRDVQLSMRG